MDIHIQSKKKKTTHPNNLTFFLTQLLIKVECFFILKKHSKKPLFLHKL
jgi:hypothetical protein